MKLDEYANRFTNIAIDRSEGVLTMRLHTEGSAFLWSDVSHRELPHAFRAIASDPENRAVVLAGTGSAFCDAALPGSFAFDPSVPPVGLNHIYEEGKELLFSLLDIPVPMIAAINGPAWIHAELALLCDIAIASTTATFRDPHLASGIVPGDGGHLIWPILLGEMRGRYFLLTDQELDAAEALRIGVVNEVVPQDRVLRRAQELASLVAARPPLVLRHTRELLTARVKQIFQQYLPFGLALEGFSSGYGAWR